MNELLYNAEGYKDETAYKAILRSGGTGYMNGYEINKGEIWEVEGNGYGTKLVVVLNCYERYAATIMLQDQEPTSNPVAVRARDIMYADAGRLGYVFYDKMVDFIRKLSDEEDQALRAAISESLELGVICEQIPEDTAELTLRLEASRAEADTLRRAAQEYENMVAAAEANLEAARQEIVILRQEVEKCRVEAALALQPVAQEAEVDTQAIEDLAAARKEAEIYKGLYEQLLARALG